MNRTTPASLLPYSKETLELLSGLIEASDGLTLGQVCKITGLETSTIQNWVKRRFVPKPVNKKYHERQVARILLISSLKSSMKLESIGEIMTYINGDADDESDDIISESELYGYLCEAIAKSDKVPEVESVPTLIKHVTKGYNAPENHKRRLEKALAAMVYAYAAGVYKNEADKILETIKE